MYPISQRRGEPPGSRAGGGTRARRPLASYRFRWTLRDAAFGTYKRERKNTLSLTMLLGATSWMWRSALRGRWLLTAGLPEPGSTQQPPPPPVTPPKLLNVWLKRHSGDPCNFGACSLGSKHTKTRSESHPPDYETVLGISSMQLATGCLFLNKKDAGLLLCLLL